MDTHVAQLFIINTLGVATIFSVLSMVALYAHNVYKEIDDKHAEYSRQRREDYQKQRIRSALLGLLTLIVILLITLAFIYIF